MAVTAVLFAMWIAHISLIVAEYKQSAIQSVIRFITDAPPAQCRGPIGMMPPACAQFLKSCTYFYDFMLVDGPVDLRSSAVHSSCSSRPDCCMVAR